MILTYNDELIRVKKTKSVMMAGSEHGVWLDVIGRGTLFIPMNKVFQVKRGLESYIQRFYRKKKK